MKKIFLAMTMLLSPLFYSTAVGCICPTVGTTTQQEKRLKDFNSAVAVFSGEVIELEENRVKFKVDKLWKGQLVDEIIMVIQLKKDDGGYVRTSCDYYYEIGEKLLIYAYGTKNELTTYQCTRTTSFKNAERAEQEIKGLNEIKLPNLRNDKPNNVN